MQTEQRVVPTVRNESLEQQRAAIAQAERTLLAQRTELLRMMGDLKQMQEALRSKQAPELDALHAENEQLRQALAEREHERDVLTQALIEREQEIETYRAKVAEGTPATPAPNPEQEQRLAALQKENETLRRVQQEKDAVIEEQRNEKEDAARPKMGMDDLERYEVELHQFRRQVEQERAKLAVEIQQLRTKNQELDDATREMEMEMSRDRADLARERTRLDRLREEVRAEMERYARDNSMWDRLAPVQRLRDQLNEQKSTPR